MPQAEPGALSQGLIMPTICSRDIAGGERPYIWCFEHLFQLLDFVDYALHIHGGQYSEVSFLTPLYSTACKHSGHAYGET